MRIYGMRSGRNNMSRLLARSVMYNSPKKRTNNINNNSNTTTSIWVYIIAIIIVALLFNR